MAAGLPKEGERRLKASPLSAVVYKIINPNYSVGIFYTFAARKTLFFRTRINCEAVSVFRPKRTRTLAVGFHFLTIKEFKFHGSVI